MEGLWGDHENFIRRIRGGDALQHSMAQTQTAPPPVHSGDSSTEGMDRSKPAQLDMSNMKEMSMSDEKQDAGRGARDAFRMEGHMDMGPHRKMTAFGQPRPGDGDRTQEVVEEARKAIEI